MTDTNNQCQTVRLCNRRGLHARAAARFAATADQFPADISVCFDGRTVNGKSIMGLMMLAAAFEKDITICSQHPDSNEQQRALEALVALVQQRFDEPE